jgi:hypothetical protein
MAMASTVLVTPALLQTLLIRTTMPPKRANSKRLMILLLALTTHGLKFDLQLAAEAAVATIAAIQLDRILLPYSEMETLITAIVRIFFTLMRMDAGGSPTQGSIAKLPRQAQQQ